MDKKKIDNYTKFWLALIVIGFSGIFAAAAIGMGSNPYVFLLLWWGFICILVTAYGVLSKSDKIVGYSISNLMLSFFIILIVIEMTDPVKPSLGLILIYIYIFTLGIVSLFGTYLDKIRWVQTDMYYQMLEEYRSKQKGKN